MELLKFIFSSFWVFIGCLIMLYLVLATIDNIVCNIAKVILLRKIKREELLRLIKWADCEKNEVNKEK